MLLTIILVSLVIMLASFVGIFFVSKKVFREVQQHLHYLISLSAGVFLVVAGSLFKETLELASVGVTFLYAVAGFLMFFALSFLLREYHHHHGEDCSHIDHGKGARMLIGDSLHNIIDGVLLAAAFVVSVRLGITVALGILLHEILQEIAEFFVLIEAGYSKKQALLLNFLVSGTILIGAVVGYFFLDAIQNASAPLLGIAAGNLLYIALVDLLAKPLHSRHEHQEGDIPRRGKILWHLAYLTIGALLMIIIFNTGSTAHEHDNAELSGEIHTEEADHSSFE